MGGKQRIARFTDQSRGEAWAVMVVGGFDSLAQGLGEVLVELLDVLERFTQVLRGSPRPLQRLSEFTAPQL
ncbi:hypothetical protein PJN29_18260 [Mycobacterium kansasii]